MVTLPLKYPSLKPVVLKDLDGGGVDIGIEMVRVVAHHAAKVGNHIGRKRVLIGDDAHRFKIIGVLKLRFRRLGGVERVGMRRLLNLLVGKLISRKLMPHDNAQSVF